MGGHGRTGYFASLILGKLGIEDPIAHLRENYCENSVETNSQVKAISEFCNNPDLIDKYDIPERSKWGYYNKDYDAFESFNYSNSAYNPTCFNYNSSTKTCKDCVYYEKYDHTSWGECLLDNKTTTGDSTKCDDFEEDVYDV